MTSADLTPENPIASSAHYGKLRGRLRGDAVIYATTRVATAVASFAMVVVLSRALAPSDLGLYSLLVNASSIVSLVAFTWLGTSAYRYSASYTETGTLVEMRSSLARLYALIALGVAAVTIGAWAIGLPLIGTLPAPVVIAWVLLLGSAGPAASIGDLFRADGRTRNSVLVVSVVNLAPLVLVLVWTWVANVELVSAIALQAATALLVFVPVSFAWGSRRGLGRDAREELVRRFARYGWPLVAAGACSWALSVGDRYLLVLFASTEDVAVYTVAYQLGTAPLLFVYGMVASPLEPLIFSAQASHDDSRAGQILGRAFAVVLALTTFAWLLVVSQGARVLTAVLPAAYERGGSLIPVLAAGAVFSTLAMVWQQGHALSDRTGVIFRNLLAASVLNIVLNVILIPIFGIAGAAAASALAYASFFVLTIGSTRREFPIAIPKGWLLSTARAFSLALLGFLAVRVLLQESLLAAILEATVVTALFVGGLASRRGDSLLSFLKNLVTSGGSTA